MTTYSEEAKEREEIEQVFGLTGGELEDKPWHYVRWVQQRPDWGKDQKQEHDYKSDPGKLRFWYEGVPDYAGGDFKDQYDPGVTYRTAVYCRLYGHIGPGDKIEDGSGDIWECVRWYDNSGETQCPLGWDQEGGPGSDSEDSLVKEEECKNPDMPGRCYLCEEEVGEEHRYIYLGDGMGEGVFKLESTKETREMRELINKLNREQCVEILEGAGIQTHDHETLEVLHEAVRVNVEDETIDGDEVRDALSD